MGFGLLSVSIWLPIAVGILLLALGRDDNPGVARWLALVGSVASFLVTLPLISGFDRSSAALQFQEKMPWIERFNVHYHLGVDGISVWFVLLTAFVSIIVVVAAWEVITQRVAQYMGAFLILSGPSAAQKTPTNRPDRIRKAAMYGATRSVITCQPATTTTMLMKAVSNTNQTDRPSTPRW